MSPHETPAPTTTTFAEFAERADYSLLDSLQADPQATVDGLDHQPRQVCSGHYVPVTPTPLRKKGRHYAEFIYAPKPAANQKAGAVVFFKRCAASYTLATCT